MNIKEIYPLFIDKQLSDQFGDWYIQIKQAFKENRIEDFVEELFKNPQTNSFASTVTDDQISCTTQRFIAIFEWLKNKQIYKFDADLWELIQNVEKLEIRSSVFKSLPFNVFWIEHEFENNLNGCMVIYGEYNGENYLKLIFIADDNMSYLCLPFRSEIEGKTIEDLIAEHSNSDVPNWYKNNLRAVLNAIVYLCTDKPDISTYQTELPVSSVPKANKSNTKKKKAEKKKNVTSVSNVGLTIGRYIRETKRTVSSTHTGNGSGSGTPKAPHMRKAHYHSFWTKDGDKKRLIVKFLSPILVNGGKADDIQPTIRVRSKNEKNN